MPEISRFFGIVVRMNIEDHPPPHFHARYGGENVAIEVATLTVLAGGIQPRALGLVMEWASRHQEELMANWKLVSEGKLPNSIQPLN